MHRVAVCLLFITIFQNGIKTSLQDDPTTPAPEKIKKVKSSKHSIRERKDSADLEKASSDYDSDEDNNHVTAGLEEPEYTTKHKKTIQTSVQDDPTTPPSGSLKQGSSSESTTKENTEQLEKRADDDSRREDYTTIASEELTEPSTQRTKAIRGEDSNRNRDPKTMEEIEMTTPRHRHEKPESDFSSKLFDPVIQVQARIRDAVAKGVDGAKDIADGAYHFLRDTVKGLF